MICSLCLTKSEEPIAINSDEGQQLNLSFLLEKYFPFCSSEDLNYFFICRDCLAYVQKFHEFYLRIEKLHNCKSALDIETNVLCTDIKEERSSSPDTEDLIAELSSELLTDTNQPPNESSDDAQFLTECSMRKVEKRLKGIKCSTCEIRFRHRNDVTKHFKSVHGKCAEENCFKSFKLQSSLDNHRKKCHSKSRCTYCDKIISSGEMNSHIKSVHLRTATICHVCGKVLGSQSTLIGHYRMVHTSNNKLQCDICKTWLKNRDSLVSHMRVHIQTPEACNICGKTLANRRSLISHLKIHNEELRDRYKCVVCGRGFRKREKLQEHSYIHSGVSDAYRCEFCGKTFRFGSSWSAHRRKMHIVEIKEREQTHLQNTL